MEFAGHMITVTWDGKTLTVRGSNKAARVALAGKDHDQGDVVLSRDEVASAVYRKPGALTNGSLTLRTTEGRKYILHFRGKHRGDFERLAEDLA